LVNSYWIALGVSPTKTGLLGGSYSWSSNNSKYNGSGGTGCNVSCDWATGDLVELELDCDSRQLRIRNMRTERSDLMGVPAGDLFPFFDLYAAGNSIALQF